MGQLLLRLARENPRWGYGRPAHRERYLEHPDQARGDLLGLLRRDQFLEHDGELVASAPRDGVPRAGDALEPAGDIGQHEIADLVPEAVVDVLEAIEVEEEDRQRAEVPRDASARLPEAVLAERASLSPSGRRGKPGAPVRAPVAHAR